MPTYRFLRMIFQILIKIRWQSSYNVMSVLYKEPYECSKENNLLTIHQDRYGWREKNRYKLFRTNWFGVKRKILEENIKAREQIGFLLLLKSLCYNHCNYTDYYGKDLQKIMTLKRSMIDNYLRALEARQYIKRDKKKKRITILRDDLFLTTKESEKEKIMKLCPEVMGDNDYIDEYGTIPFCRLKSAMPYIKFIKLETGLRIKN